MPKKPLKYGTAYDYPYKAKDNTGMTPAKHRRSYLRQLEGRIPPDQRLLLTVNHIRGVLSIDPRRARKDIQSQKRQQSRSMPYD